MALLVSPFFACSLSLTVAASAASVARRMEKESERTDPTSHDHDDWLPDKTVNLLLPAPSSCDWKCARDAALSLLR